MKQPEPSPLNLWAPFDRAATHAPLITVWDGTQFVEWTWDDWRTEALRCCNGLAKLGIQAGDRVGCLFTNSPGACAALLGVWLRGGQVVSLPTPARGMNPQAYMTQLRAILAEAQADVLLCDRSLADAMDDMALGAAVNAFQRLPTAGSAPVAVAGSDDVVFVQYSSGSTGSPKGCALTAGAIAHQLRSLSTRLAIDPEKDRGAVWLPMSHDMGLFGCVLLSYWTAHPVLIGTPDRFLLNPGNWLADCSAFEATISATPAFGLELAERYATRSGCPRLSLDKLVVGGEHVEASTIAGFRSALQGQLSSRVLMPAYGLAEAVLAVTMAGNQEPVRTMHVDARALRAGRVEQVERPGETSDDVAELVSCGHPIPNTRVTIAGRADVGEICIESAFLSVGYLNDLNRGASQRGSVLRTGDQGLMHDGELYVTGRLDDLVSIAGRNVYMRDLERPIALAAGVTPSKCTVVDVRDGGRVRLVAIVESAKLQGPATTLQRPAIAAARKLSKAARDHAGVFLDEVLFLEKGQLPRTPSGKPQRFKCREMATASTSAIAARVELRPSRASSSRAR